ncbi:MAG: hypothetical protein KAT71_02330 [Gammaproteobacteria bacterium]|nr:hypothetical protein [Gammaproteobacteria bacterium]
MPISSTDQEILESILHDIATLIKIYKQPVSITQSYACLFFLKRIFGKLGNTTTEKSSISTALRECHPNFIWHRYKTVNAYRLRNYLLHYYFLFHRRENDICSFCQHYIKPLQKAIIALIAEENNVLMPDDVRPMRQQLLRDYQRTSAIDRSVEEYISDLHLYAFTFIAIFKEIDTDPNAYYACLNCVEVMGDIFHKLQHKGIKKEQDLSTGRSKYTQVSDKFEKLLNSMKGEGIQVDTFLNFRNRSSHYFAIFNKQEIKALMPTMLVLNDQDSIARYKRLYLETTATTSQEARTGTPPAIAAAATSGSEFRFIPRQLRNKGSSKPPPSKRGRGVSATTERERGSDTPQISYASLVHELHRRYEAIEAQVRPEIESAVRLRLREELSQLATDHQVLFDKAERIPTTEQNESVFALLNSLTERIAELQQRLASDTAEDVDHSNGVNDTLPSVTP